MPRKWQTTYYYLGKEMTAIELFKEHKKKNYGFSVWFSWFVYRLQKCTTEMDVISAVIEPVTVKKSHTYPKESCKTTVDSTITIQSEDIKIKRDWYDVIVAIGITVVAWRILLEISMALYLALFTQ